MAHCEISVDSNIVDIAFSRAGTRIAVLTTDNFFIFSWSLKSKPVPTPVLESSYPLPQDSNSRPRQIAFLGDNEVFVIIHHDPFDRRIERTRLDTRETTVSYTASAEEHIQNIFLSIKHEKLWVSKSSEKAKGTTYLAGVPSPEKLELSPFDHAPLLDTHWAASTGISDDQVCSLLKSVL
jgi:elongator complex protein 1